MNRRRRHLVAAAVAGTALSLVNGLAFGQAPASSTDRPYRIFMILYRGETDVEKGFRDHFTSRSIPVELIVRNVELDIAKVPSLLDEARQLGVDLIYTWGTPVTLAVVGKSTQIDPAKHITDIPVVFTMVASPEGSGLVATRTSSGRNITGASHVVPIGQQLEAMRAYRPLRRLAILYNSTEPNAVLTLRELRRAAQQDRFELIEQPVPLDADGKPLDAALPDAIAKIVALQPQLLYLGPDSYLAANRKVVTETALAARLPVFSATEIALRDGKALFGLVSRYDMVGRLTAYKAEQILVKKLPAKAVPIETLSRFSYIVNMAVATDLGFYPPLKVLNYAEIVR